MRTIGSLIGTVLLLAAAACAGGPGDRDIGPGGMSGTAKSGVTGVNTDVGDALIAMVSEEISVPADALQATTIGEGTVAVETSDAPGDIDSIWIDSIDFDGDGDIQETHFLWDDEDMVLYAYSDETFDCMEGGTGTGGMLVAIYGVGNSFDEPAGSGWYVVGLDAGECYADEDTLWGCTFDATGQETECGVATIDDATDMIHIITVQIVD